MAHVLDDLTAHLDGALPPARRAAVEGHLAGCESCRTERERLRGALALLGALRPPPEPSPSFTARLAARLAAEPARAGGALGRLLAWRWRLALPATGLAVAAAVAVLVVRHQRAEELALAGDLELLESYELVVSLGEVETAEDAAVVAALDDLGHRRTTP